MKSLLIVIICTLAASAGAKTTFRYNLKKGDVLRYKSTSNSDLTMNQMGHDMSFNTISDGTIRAEVEDATADQFTYITSMEDFTVKISSGGPSMGMGDTTMKVNDIVGKRTRRVATRLGKDLSTFMVDTPHYDSPMMKKFASGSTNMTRLLMQLPNQPVGIGDTWEVAKKDTSEADGGGIYSEVTIKCTYVRDVDTLGRHCAVVGYSLTIAMEGKMKFQKQFDAEITGDGAGKGSGFFDAAAGVLVANSSTIELNQNIAITGQQMNMVMPQTITTTTNTALMQ